MEAGTFCWAKSSNAETSKPFISTVSLTDNFVDFLLGAI